MVAKHCFGILRSVVDISAALARSRTDVQIHLDSELYRCLKLNILGSKMTERSLKSKMVMLMQRLVGQKGSHAETVLTFQTRG